MQSMQSFVLRLNGLRTTFSTSNSFTEMSEENPFSMENHDNLKNHSLGYIWSPAIISLRELGLNLEYYQQVLISK